MNAARFPSYKNPLWLLPSRASEINEALVRQNCIRCRVHGPLRMSFLNPLLGSGLRQMPESLPSLARNPRRGRAIRTPFALSLAFSHRTFTRSACDAFFSRR